LRGHSERKKEKEGGQQFCLPGNNVDADPVRIGRQVLVEAIGSVVCSFLFAVIFVGRRNDAQVEQEFENT